MADTTRLALLALTDPEQERLWRAELEGQGLRCEALAAGRPVMRAALQHPVLHAGGTLVAGLERVAAERLDPLGIGSALEERAPEVELVYVLERRIEVSPAERAFARHCGARDLLARRFENTTDPAAPPAVAARMRGRGGVARLDRRYHGDWYVDCFVGREAVDWLVRELSLARPAATTLGQFLLEHGVFHHVVKEHPFLDQELFYRFGEATPAIETVAIHDLLQKMWAHNALPIAPRSYHGRSYDACFVGSEAVDWMVSNCALTREESVTLGQRLIDLALVHHVVDEHPFVDGFFFYRFRRHELQER